MRPYSSRKDGDVTKYQISNQQSSPLALLAATCNKIGDSTSFSDTFHKDKEFTTVKSCGSDTPRLSPFVSIDRNYNYATTLKHHEPKKDVIAETRSHEAFERTVFSKSSCSHFDNPSYVASQEVTFPQCAHSSENSSSSSCLFESNTDSSSHHHTHPQQSSCAMEDLNFQGSALHNLTQQNSPVLTTIPSIIPPSYHNSPNYSKSYQWPSTYREQPQKSSCMVQEDFENNNIPTLQSLSTVRTTRTSSLSHISTPVSPHHPLPSPSQSPFMQQYNNPSFPQQLSPQHQQAFPHYSSHNSPVDIKQEPMMMPTSNFRPPVSPYTSPTMSYPEPLQSDLKWSSNHSLRHHEPMPSEHNHPAGMTSSFCPACNSPSGVSYPPHPGSAQTIGLPPHMTPQNEMMRGMAEMSEYHYQQQQMFYARDNRRPRRIACTCPNCRDGENKTVTTKDGKQRKLHICHVPGCGKVYGKTSHLRAHLRWHAGERPFACNWLFCNKRFTRSDELQRHRRTHTGDKRFECSVCLKKFMRSDHLSKHMKTHQAQIKKSEEKTKTPVATPTTMTTLDNKSAVQKVKTEIVENK